MSEQRITRVPAPPGFDRTTGPRQLGVVGKPNEPVPSFRRLTHSCLWLCLRLAFTALAVTAFVYICWLMSGSDYSTPRMFSGPLFLFRTQSSGDKASGIAMTAVLLPCMFAVGVWRNAATIVLSILAMLCWIALGFWIEGD